MTRKWLFALCCSIFSSAVVAVTIEDVNVAINDTFNYLHSYKSITEIDEKRLQNNIDILESGSREITFSPEDFAIILRAQLNAAEAINRKYKFNNLPIDVSQVQKLLNNLDDLKEVTDSYLGDLEYTAGQISAHQLDNYSLAYLYWSTCGEAGHAGCMNILASSYESGEFVVEQDLEKAVYWHSKTVNTGIRWMCAGLFSARRLAVLNTIGIETHKSTSFWLDAASELRAKLATHTAKSGVCDEDSEYLLNYVLLGFDDKWLDKIATIKLDSKNIVNNGREKYLSLFSKAKTIEELKPALEIMYDDNRRCISAEEFALKVRKNSTALNQILNYVSNLDSEQCASEKYTINRLHQQSQADKNSDHVTLELQ